MISFVQWKRIERLDPHRSSGSPDKRYGQRPKCWLKHGIAGLTLGFSVSSSSLSTLFAVSEYEARLLKEGFRVEPAVVEHGVDEDVLGYD